MRLLRRKKINTHRAYGILRKVEKINEDASILSVECVAGNVPKRRRVFCLQGNLEGYIGQTVRLTTTRSRYFFGNWVSQSIQFGRGRGIYTSPHAEKLRDAVKAYRRNLYGTPMSQDEYIIVQGEIGRVGANKLWPM